MAAGTLDGRGAKPFRAVTVAEAIEHWRQSQGDGAVNLAELHAWLVAEHTYDGSLRSVQRFWARRYPAPALRARRRVETPAGAQAQADWAHFSQAVVGREVKNLVAFKMMASHSRKDAIVWSESKDMLAWLGCHSQAFHRLGGVPATVRIDNEKTAIVRGAGAWGSINPSYRRYATTLRFHIDACPPRQPRCKGKIERRVRNQRFAIDPRRHSWGSLADLQQWTDAQLTARSDRLICPATGLTVAESWAAERSRLTPLPGGPAGTLRRCRRGCSAPRLTDAARVASLSVILCAGHNERQGGVLCRAEPRSWTARLPSCRRSRGNWSTSF